MRRVALAFGADLVCVLVFAALGRASHDEGATLAGYAETAWPFVAGLVVGWAITRASLRGWPQVMWHTAPIWLGTVIVGMALRALTDQGTALPFVAVAALVLGLLFFGWRGLVTTMQWLQRWLEQKGTEAAAREHRERMLQEKAERLLRAHREGPD